MTALETDLLRAVATVVETAKALRDTDGQFRIELAAAAREVSIERGITRDLIAAVHARIDATENAAAVRHRELLEAIARVGARHG